MSRATRRQQRGGKQPSKKPPRAVLAKQPTRPAGSPPVAQRKRGIIPPFFSDVFAELRRVVWPSREETTNLTVVVIIVAVAVGLILGGIDIFFERLIEEVLL